MILLVLSYIINCVNLHVDRKKGHQPFIFLTPNYGMIIATLNNKK